MKKMTLISLLILAITVLIASCSSAPRYKNVWVHSGLDENDRKLAKDLCSLEASSAENNYRNANPLKNNKYSDTDALNDFAITLGARKIRKTAYRACMTSVGFRKEDICVSNCD